MLVSLVLDSPLDGAAKLVEAAGKGNLAFASLLVLVLAYLALRLFPPEKTPQWLRISIFVVMIACIVFFIFVLAVPLPKTEPNTPSNEANNHTQKLTEPPPATEPKHCAGTHDEVCHFPGILDKDAAGNYIDLGDGGGGTRFYQWTCRWKAPATVSSNKCFTGRNQHVIAENHEGSNAECTGNINGGNDPVTMHVVFDGPCDQQ